MVFLAILTGFNSVSRARLRARVQLVTLEHRFFICGSALASSVAYARALFQFREFVELGGPFRGGGGDESPPSVKQSGSA